MTIFPYAEMSSKPEPESKSPKREPEPTADDSTADTNDDSAYSEESIFDEVDNEEEFGVRQRRVPFLETSEVPMSSNLQTDLLLKESIELPTVNHDISFTVSF